MSEEIKNTPETKENTVVEAAEAGVKAHSPKKPKKQKSGVRFYKKPGFRYSMLATVLSIVFIAVIVAVNILASMLDSRINALQLDMTLSKDYSLSADNIEYIKKIDKDVTVTVAATENYYMGGSYSNFLYSNYYYSDTSGGKYFNQTIQLLKKYPKVNGKIKVQFIDPTTPAFNDFNEKYANQYTYGSIIVESEFVNSNGAKQSRYKILQVEDIYATSTDSSSSYGDTYINGSQLESALTTALFYVISEQQNTAAIVTGYNCDSADAVQSLLKQNNYDIIEIDSLTASDIPSNVDLLVFATPQTDLMPSEILKLDAFMKNDGNYRKNILYVASNTQTTLPNFESFLGEWGIQIGSGTVYETDEKYRSTVSNTWMYLKDGGTNYLADFSGMQYIARDMRPITLKFEQKGEEPGSYYTYNLVKTMDSTTIMPSGEKEDWTPANNATKQAFSAMAMSVFAVDRDENGRDISSSILVLASEDFYSDNYASSCANQDALTSIINTMVGRTEQAYTVDNKTITSHTFTPTEIQSNIIKYVCVGVIPVGLLIFGIVIVIRRKRK
ncbi:MAG: GldG family protein [Acutalibacteraceae bacterium]|nr:GldG family protein [Acutalibacteraceae bacterium]